MELTQPPTNYRVTEISKFIAMIQGVPGSHETHNAGGTKPDDPRTDLNLLVDGCLRTLSWLDGRIAPEVSLTILVFT